MPAVDIDLTRTGNGISVNLVRGDAVSAAEAATLNGVAVSGTPEAGQVLTAASATAATWEDAAGGTSSVGGNGAADSGLLVEFNHDGGIKCSTQLEIYGSELWSVAPDEVATFVLSFPVLAEADDQTVTFPARTGTVVLDTDPTFIANADDIAAIEASLPGYASLTGSYADPSWITSLAKSKVGLGSVENTALSTWAGSTAITTLGTIATGTVPAANVSGLGSLATQSGTFSGTSSGTNTGDQTTISGNAGTATALATSRTIGGSGFDGTANVTSFPEPGAIGGTTPSSGSFTTLAASSTLSLSLVASLGGELSPAIASGNYSVGAGWESPFVGPGLIKNANGTGTASIAGFSATVGVKYQVEVVVSSMSVSSFTIAIGGDVYAVTATAAGTYRTYLTATTTAGLIITPTNTSRFTITGISVKVFTPADHTIASGIINTTATDNRVLIGPNFPGGDSFGVDSVVAIGYNAARRSTQNTYGIHIGRHAGSNSGIRANATNVVQIGHAAGQYSVTPQEVVQIGYLCGQNANQAATTNVYRSVMIGSNAGKEMVVAQHAIVIGSSAGNAAASATGATIIGGIAGQGTGTLDFSVMLGYGAGGSANSSNSVFIGRQAGQTLSTNSRLVIETNTTYGPTGTGAIIYGEFDNRVLVFNASTTIGTSSSTIALFGGTRRAQPSRAGQLTDNSGGTSGGSTIAAVAAPGLLTEAASLVSTANAIATLAARINLIEDKLSAAGTGIGVTA